ncbi:MAG: hypothetical protein J6P03_06255 [Opitutales bacterium]|nr:hypothetical protein [Opitutales bacterium]
MKTILLLAAAALAAIPFSLHAERSKEPVVITKCRSFSARNDDQSKIALAGKFRRENSQRPCGDCDDINDVCKNTLLEVSGDGFETVFKLRAHYPDGRFYDYFIKIAAPKNPFAEDAELWASSSADFGASTYAVAVSDSEKEGFYEIFRAAEGAEALAKNLLDAFAAKGDISKLTSAQKLAAQKTELERARILEALSGVCGGGSASEFAASEEWFNPKIRAEKYAELRAKFLDNKKPAQ